MQWNTADRELLNTYRVSHSLTTPPAFKSPLNQALLSNPGIGKQTPSMARRKDKRRVSKDQLALAVRKNFNAAAVSEIDVMVELLYKVRSQGRYLHDIAMRRGDADGTVLQTKPFDCAQHQVCRRRALDRSGQPACEYIFLSVDSRQWTSATGARLRQLFLCNCFEDDPYYAHGSSPVMPHLSSSVQGRNVRLDLCGIREMHGRPSASTIASRLRPQLRQHPSSSG